MSITALFVVNPIAGGTDKKILVSKIKSWAQSSNHKVEIMETTGEDDEKNIRENIEKLHPEKLVAVGGDGTLLLCAQILKDSEISLGTIPSGSANGMCTELRIPADADEALQIIEAGHTRKIDMLLFNDKDLALHISDIGLNARLVKHFEEGESRGFLGYAKGVISELIQVKPFKASIKCKDKSIDKECYMVAFANASRYGTGALLNHLGKSDDGLFEICILKELNLAGIAGQFFDRINENSEHMEVIQCTEVTVKTDRPVSFQIDGELQEDTQLVKVNILPACLKMILPTNWPDQPTVKSSSEK